MGRGRKGREVGGGSKKEIEGIFFLMVQSDVHLKEKKEKKNR